MMKTAKDFWLDTQHPFRPPIISGEITALFHQTELAPHTLWEGLSKTRLRYVSMRLLHDPDGRVNGAIRRDGAKPSNWSLLEYQQKIMPIMQTRLGLIVTVYNIMGADFVRNLGASALRISADNIINGALIRHSSTLGLPIVLNITGATLADIEQAISWINEVNNQAIVLQYTPPAPPAPVEHHNMRLLPDLNEKLKLPTSLQDQQHSQALVHAATALGTRLLEKNLCMEKADNNDSYHATPLGEIDSLINDCGNIHAALGNSEEALRLAQVRTRPAEPLGLAPDEPFIEDEQYGASHLGFLDMNTAISVKR